MVELRAPWETMSADGFVFYKQAMAILAPAPNPADDADDDTTSATSAAATADTTSTFTSAVVAAAAAAADATSTVAADAANDTTSTTSAAAAATTSSSAAATSAATSTAPVTTPASPTAPPPASPPVLRWITSASRADYLGRIDNVIAVYSKFGNTVLCVAGVVLVLMAICFQVRRHNGLRTANALPPVLLCPLRPPTSPPPPYATQFGASSVSRAARTREDARVAAMRCECADCPCSNVVLTVPCCGAVLLCDAVPGACVLLCGAVRGRVRSCCVVPCCAWPGACVSVCLRARVRLCSWPSSSSPSSSPSRPA